MKIASQDPEGKYRSKGCRTMSSPRKPSTFVKSLPQVANDQDLARDCSFIWTQNSPELWVCEPRSNLPSLSSRSIWMPSSYFAHLRLRSGRALVTFNGLEWFEHMVLVDCYLFAKWRKCPIQWEEAALYTGHLCTIAFLHFVFLHLSTSRSSQAEFFLRISKYNRLCMLKM